LYDGVVCICSVQVIFSDESMFSIAAYKTHVRRRSNEKFNPQCVVPTVKHPLSVMVWGCFSFYGPGRLYVVPKGTTVNSQLYKEILETRMLPSASQLYPHGDYIYQDDGAPCHRSKVIKSWFADHGVTPMHDWPGQSPDINPIENLWFIMKRMVSKGKPTSRVTLIEEVIKAWNHTVTLETLQKLVESMPRRIACVIAAKGYATKY
jgi:hypothetical protein